MGRGRMWKTLFISLLYATCAVLCHVVVAAAATAAESKGIGEPQMPSTLPFHQYLSTGSCENDLNQIKITLNRMWISIAQLTQNSEKISKMEQLLFEDLKKCSNPCNPNPCLNGGRCQLTPAGNDYVCTSCPLGTSGKNCEQVACNRKNNCLQFLDKMYFYYQEQSDWSQANQKCSTLGMNMAMPKDQQTTSYLIYELRSRFDQSTNTHFWIGLKPYGSVWTWNDGTPLGEYTGGFPNFKAQLGDRWAILWLTGGDVWWYPQIYGEIAKNPYYPLCEKSISTK